MIVLASTQPNLTGVHNMCSSLTREPLDLNNRVAVITGGASGIGLALALRAAQAGMRVALADIEQGTLDRAVERVQQAGAPKVIGVITDVSRLESVQALAQAVKNQLGEPWLIVNNAGVAKPGLSWVLKNSDWSWMVGVNLGGVIHGITTFLPGLVERNAGYVINTASAAGLMGVPGGAAYVASKHAVVGLSESIYRELRAVKSSVGLSVLCPAAVDTRIAYADRNQPGVEHYEAPTEGLPPIPLEQPLQVLSPQAVADHVFEAMEQQRFWVLPHTDLIGPAIRARAAQITEQRNPDAVSVDRESAFVHSLATGVDFVE